VARLIGGQPRPRMIVYGLPTVAALSDELAHLVPTIRIVEDYLEWQNFVRQQEFDCAVVFGDAPPLESHMYVIQFGGAFLFTQTEGQTTWKVEARGRSVAQEFMVDDLPAPISSLVQSDLLPQLRENASHPTLSQRAARWKDDPGPENWGTFSAFLRDADAQRLAGRFARDGDGPEWWWIPAVTPQATKWVAVALEQWAEKDAARFPSGPAWRDLEAWRTPEESSAAAEVENVERRRVELLQSLAIAAAEAETKLRDFTAVADANERRLLTAQGEDLVEEVAVTLREFGFEVEDVDRTRAKPGDHLEDLRVVDPGHGDKWIALCEVRGYSGGAQLNDLLRLGRFEKRFFTETGTAPSAIWYVVNHSLKSSPDARQEPLASNPAEVLTFGEGDGLVIDTRALFRLRMSVRRQDTSADEVRRLLREARGLLDLK
jgi:hypothetical protein